MWLCMLIACSLPCLTVAAEHQWRGGTLNAGLGDRVGHHAGVVAHVWGLHFGDVQVPRLLRDKAAGVLLHEGRVLIEDPGKYQIWRRHRMEMEIYSQGESILHMTLIWGQRWREKTNVGTQVILYMYHSDFKYFCIPFDQTGKCGHSSSSVFQIKLLNNHNKKHTLVTFSSHFLSCQIQICHCRP